MPKDLSVFISAQKDKSAPDIAEIWATLEDHYNKKLWHQVTLGLQKLVKNPNFKKETLVEVYHNFISEFESRINYLSLVELVSQVVEQIHDQNEATAFLLKVQEKVKTDKEAVILCKTLIGQIKLHQKNYDEAKKIIQEAEELLDSLDGVSPVHGTFYELSSDYYRVMAKHALYYKDALRYLGCIELDTLQMEEQAERAFYLGLAALLGEGVYNFGELLAHPILESLKNTSNNWLVDLLYTFNSGNLPEYERLRPHWSSQVDLAANELHLRQKISLLCLMEMTFKRPANSRQLTFDEISKEARLPKNEVELLVMKALSLGLVRGSIDQVDENVHMSWVQPRVLDRNQIATMQNRLLQWCSDVKSMENLLEEKAQDILT